MWAPVVAFTCILAMMGILLSLPFLLTRARRVPALNRALDKLAFLMGAPWPPYEESAPQHVRKPLSRTALNNLAISHYKAPTVAAAAAAADCEAQSEDADSCPICFCEYFEGQALITLPCKHFFHKECIRIWLKRDATCPMCKLDLQETAEQPSSSSSSSNGATSSSSSSGGSNETGQAVSTAAAAAAQPAGTVVAGVPVVTGSPAPAATAAAAAGEEGAASNPPVDEQCLAEDLAQPAGQSVGGSSPLPLQAVVITVQ
jgi:hypothetical protein